MQLISLYQVDAFSKTPFKGNPAAVCPLNEWLPTSVMQSIAMENNLSETAFFVRDRDEFHIRWFTPLLEIDLAGHPTLATAHVIFHELNYVKDNITFKTKLGDELRIDRDGEIINMDFPARMPNKHDNIELIKGAIDIEPIEFFSARDGVAVLRNETEVKEVIPSMDRISQLNYTGLIVTAPGDSADFVSRFFAPQVGVPEDPVTGSAHCELIPLWSSKLRKDCMVAKQLSNRGGTLYCENKNNRVIIGGKAVTVMTGEMRIP